MPRWLRHDEWKGVSLGETTLLITPLRTAGDLKPTNCLFSEFSMSYFWNGVDILWVSETADTETVNGGRGLPYADDSVEGKD